MWTLEMFHTALQAKKVWRAAIPGNTAAWYPHVMKHVEEGTFTFQEFIDLFAASKNLSYAEVINLLCRETGDV
jgi:hypothetical protein